MGIRITIEDYTSKQAFVLPHKLGFAIDIVQYEISALIFSLFSFKTLLGVGEGMFPSVPLKDVNLLLFPN